MKYFFVSTFVIWSVSSLLIGFLVSERKAYITHFFSLFIILFWKNEQNKTTEISNLKTSVLFLRKGFTEVTWKSLIFAHTGCPEKKTLLIEFLVWRTLKIQLKKVLFSLTFTLLLYIYNRDKNVYLISRSCVRRLSWSWNCLSCVCVSSFSSIGCDAASVVSCVSINRCILSRSSAIEAYSSSSWITSENKKVYCKISD